ncbi:nucleoid-associated protein [Mucilaginibacter sp. McL0603]|uniref:nucleoid-associated protein n=1 Tax=Mucilaginibacter sp. McL0603 TaxID=3415670 RepID=UPI003CF0BB83
MTEALNIHIEKFIFHVVHHGNAAPTLMEETPIGAFEGFFVNRIREILNGNRFNFSDDSDFLASLRVIDADPSHFVSESQELARTFHNQNDRRIKPGVMILIYADVDRTKKYILIKYDHEEVITYTEQDGQAILSEISNTFVKSGQALQKSAVINLGDVVPGAVIVDKSERQDITDFFKEFLGVKRYYTQADLTEKAANCFMETIREHQAILPAEFTSQASNTFYDYVQHTDNFSPDQTPQELFGVYFTPEIGRTFARKLGKADISGEAFSFDKRVIRKPRKKKYRTQEGVIIQYDAIAANTVQIENEGEKTKITIVTNKLIEQPL